MTTTTISPELSRDLDKLLEMRDADFAAMDQEEALDAAKTWDPLTRRWIAYDPTTGAYL
jgi:hypothetical protein